MVSEVADQALAMGAIWQYKLLFYFEGLKSNLLCTAQQWPRLEARESDGDPGVAGRGGLRDREGCKEETSAARVGNQNRGSDGTATGCL